MSPDKVFRNEYSLYFSSFNRLGVNHIYGKDSPLHSLTLSSSFKLSYVPPVALTGLAGEREPPAATLLWDMLVLKISRTLCCNSTEQGSFVIWAFSLLKMDYPFWTYGLIPEGCLPQLLVQDIFSCVFADDSFMPASVASDVKINRQPVTKARLTGLSQKRLSDLSLHHYIRKILCCCCLKR